MTLDDCTTAIRKDYDPAAMDAQALRRGRHLRGRQGRPTTAADADCTVGIDNLAAMRAAASRPPAS
jgi:hypothetical protein